MSATPGAYSGRVSDAAIPFRKGHGTGNDFVILDDPDAQLDLTPGRVRALCDRRFGIGGDGVLRVVRAGAADVAPGLVAGARWFMDYRNSDGSIGEMCGNGARVFAVHLVSSGLESDDTFLIGTRGGPRRVWLDGAGQVRVAMGPTVVEQADSAVVGLGGETWPATPAFAPNPHAVVLLPAGADLADLGEIGGSTAGPAEQFPDGANIEFVVTESADRVALRVNERGSGETLSCGTGACAVAAVHRSRTQSPPDTVVVEVPGGELVVGFESGGTVLAGPAEIVASGRLDPDWWDRT